MKFAERSITNLSIDREDKIALSSDGDDLRITIRNDDNWNHGHQATVILSKTQVVALKDIINNFLG